MRFQILDFLKHFKTYLDSRLDQKKYEPMFEKWLNSPYPSKVKYKTKLVKLCKQKLFANLFHHQFHIQRSVTCSRSSSSQTFFKNVFLKNSAIFTRKHPCWSLRFKVTGLKTYRKSGFENPGWSPRVNPWDETLGWDPGVRPWGGILGWHPGLGVWGETLWWELGVGP